jgi:choice-of-anchor C domain-containing protein
VQKGQTFITGWGPDAGGVTVCSSYWQNSDGIRSVELYGEGGIGALLQAFDTVPGATYKVLFALAGNPGLAGGVQGPAFAVRASAGNDYLDYNFNTTGKSLANMGWIAETFTFTALAATTTLRFDALINTPGAVTYPAIDNVRVSAVPEPSAWLLLGSGLFGLIGWRKLRHSAV